MATWKILLITLLAAVLLGCIIGVAVGKHQVKKNRAGYKPLLSRKERILYAVCIVGGAACIAFGLLYTPPSQQLENEMMDGMAENYEAEAEDGNGGGRVAYHGGGTAVAVEIIG